MVAENNNFYSALRDPYSCQTLPSTTCEDGVQEVTTLEAITLQKQTPTRVNRVQDDGEGVCVTQTDRSRRKYAEGEQLSPLVVNLDPSVFGTSTNSFLLTTNDQSQNSVDERTRETYRHVMRSIGLPVTDDDKLHDSAELDPSMRSARFGCKEFPATFLRKTLLTLVKEESSLVTLNISWKDNIERKEAAKNLNAGLTRFGGGLVHIWSRENHRQSPYGMVNLEKIKECSDNCREDNVDIYAHFSQDQNRVSVLSLSEHALTLTCGRKVTIAGVSDYPAMKSAFSKVTNSDVFYEVRQEVLQKLMKTSLNISKMVRSMYKTMKKNPESYPNAKPLYSQCLLI